VDRPTVSFGFPPLTKGVKWLMIATTVVSVGVSALNAWINRDLAATLFENLHFRAGDVLRGRVWEVLTFTFVHVDPINLLIALLTLWMFAGSLERRWRTRRFVTFYFATSAAAALATTAISLASPGLRATSYAGVWTAAEAMVAAFAINYPDDRVNFFFFLPIQGRYLIHFAIGVNLLFILMSGSVMPFVCPMLGLLAGIVFARGTMAGPRHLWLRMRVWWIERRLANRKLRIVQGEKEPPPPKSGSDGWLH
jgi:membrane associated rhomboid family serine protease